MCFHKSTPKKEDLEIYLQDYQVDIFDYDSYYHANGFNHPQVPIMTMDEPHKVQPSMWGLIPVYAKDRKDAQGWANRMLNATCEKMDNTYKHYYKSQRCLVFVNGFYEWQWMDIKGKEKIPYFIFMDKHSPFTMGGIYNNWTDKETGEMFSSYSVITTPANELMTAIHNNKKRMPLIITKDNWSEWLNPDILPNDLLKPLPDGLLQSYEIGKSITSRSINTNVPETQLPIQNPNIPTTLF